jgi:hypothetical protein
MFDAEFVRSICAKMAAEQDPARVHELAETLRSVISWDIEDIRVRERLLAKHFPEVTATRAA